jgi:intracellular septation protein
MKVFLDLFPAVAFLAALLLRDIYVATVVLIATLWLSLIAWRIRFGSLRRTHLWVCLAATVLGSLTLYLHDPIFIKWKPTLVYGVFGLGFAINSLLKRPPLLHKAVGEAFDMPVGTWRKVDIAWTFFWFACAGLNLLVAYNFSEKFWGTYKIVSAYALPILFMLCHLPFIGRHLRHDEPGAT